MRPPACPADVVVLGVLAPEALEPPRREILEDRAAVLPVPSEGRSLRDRPLADGRDDFVIGDGQLNLSDLVALSFQEPVSQIPAHLLRQPRNLVDQRRR